MTVSQIRDALLRRGSRISRRTGWMVRDGGVNTESGPVQKIQGAGVLLAETGRGAGGGVWEEGRELGCGGIGLSSCLSDKERARRRLEPRLRLEAARAACRQRHEGPGAPQLREARGRGGSNAGETGRRQLGRESERGEPGSQAEARWRRWWPAVSARPGTRWGLGLHADHWI